MKSAARLRWLFALLLALLLLLACAVVFSWLSVDFRPRLCCYS